ncbi:hypothetical protein MMC29_003016 [Sticta canariensis]|nr:hypothetical protein [Sticta canariensis]
MASPWKPLHLSLGPHVPSLLVKYDFEQSKYKVFLTDLTYIWTETLERKQIVKRALDVDTSIDPSESTDQFHLLLRNIQKSLDGEEGTKLSLSSVEKSKQLNLHVVTQLPTPLNPLHWPILLTVASAEVLTAELTLQCLSQQFVAKAQIDSLLQQLKDKDHVISKLADRMHSDGTDFSKVFPGAIRSKVGANIGVRESAGKLVKGLSHFDEEHWRKTLSSLLGLSARLSDIIPRIFVPGPREIFDINISYDQADWWHQLNDEDDQEKATPGAESSKYAAKTQKDKSSDGDIQQQTAPTRMIPSISTGKEKSAAGDAVISQQQQQHERDLHYASTTTNESFDERGGDGQLQKPAGLPQDKFIRESDVRLTEYKPSPKVTQTLLEADGFEIDALIPRSAIDSRISSPETHSEKNKLLLSQNATSMEAVIKSKGKLGRIGGKTKPEKRTEFTDKPISGRSTAFDETNRAASVDSEGKGDKQVPADTESAPVGRVLASPKASVTHRESPQKKANNKREQLKRQLENKSNATVKKKRKF